MFRRGKEIIRPGWQPTKKRRMERVKDMLKVQVKQGALELESQRMWEVWGWSPESGVILRQRDGPLTALPPYLLAPEFLLSASPPQIHSEQTACTWGRSSGSE